MAGPASADSGAKSKGKLLGVNEVNAAGVGGQGDPNGRGHAAIKVSGLEVCWKYNVKNVATVAAAHIHAAPAGVNGSVVVPLSLPNTGGQASGCATVSAALAAGLSTTPSNYYVNVHTAEFPAGAVRAQLSNDS